MFISSMSGFFVSQIDRRSEWNRCWEKPRGSAMYQKILDKHGTLGCVLVKILYAIICTILFKTSPTNIIFDTLQT